MNKNYPTFFLTWFNKFSRVPYPGGFDFEIPSIILSRYIFLLYLCLAQRLIGIDIYISTTYPYVCAIALGTLYFT